MKLIFLVLISLTAVFALGPRVSVDVPALDLSAIDEALLYIRPDRDVVIDMAAADPVFERVASDRSERIIIENSNDPYGHVIAGDILSPDTTDQLAEAIANFIRTITSEVTGSIRDE